MNKVALCISLVAASLFATVSAGQQELSGDLRALQGKWRVWLAKNDSIVFEIKRGSFTMARHSPNGVGEPAKGSFTLDEKSNPKHMTWNKVAGGGFNLEINRCIYELHGDTWILIGGGEERPAHFYSGDGGPHKTWILKREK
jgi:uncharacterized protein (TIGR03067 family)